MDVAGISGIFIELEVFDEFSADCCSAATGAQEFGHDDQLQSRSSDRGGRLMIVDLESWEAGYDDGLLGRPTQCTPGLDRFSYSSGYYQARAGTQEEPQPRDARSSTRRVLQRGSSRLIII